MIIPASLALAAVLAGSGAWAQDYEPLSPPAQSPDSAIKHQTGLVMAVDAKSGRLVVKNEEGKTKRFFAKKAKVITVEGKTVSLADLSIGDRVSLSYSARGATEIVRLHKAVKR